MLKITKGAKDASGIATFQVSGLIDDVADFAAISASPETEVMINFKGVTSINSYGIKKMMNLVQSLKGKKLRFVEVPSVLIAQLNMIPSLTRGVTIESFFIPMECEACNLQYDKQVTAAEARAPGYQEELNDLFPCDKCARKLQFLDDEALFFRFLD